jgi:hypothetical protein
MTQMEVKMPPVHPEKHLSSANVLTKGLHSKAGEKFFQPGLIWVL